MGVDASHPRFARRATAALLVATAVWFIAACGSDDSSSSGKSGDGKSRVLQFAAIAKTLDNPGFAVAQKGAQERVSQLGNIKLTWTAPTTADEGQEVQLIESFIQKGVDGLLIDSLGDAVCGAVNQAVDAGIPVVMWDSDCPKSKRTAYVGSDNYAGGVEAGKIYAKTVKDKGPQRIAILTGAPGALNLQQRDAGFKAGLKQAGADFKIVTTVSGQDDVAKSVDAVNSTIRGNPSINGFYFDGPWPQLASPGTVQPVIDAVKGGKLTVMAFDTLQPQLQWVTKKWAIGLVGQRYYSWGYQGIQVLNQIVRCKAKYSKFVNTGLDIVGHGGPITPDQMNQRWLTFNFPQNPIKPSSGGC